MSQFEYLIAVDFEATCEKKDHYKIEDRHSEIIEFPAVLFNMQTGAIEAEFHQYVRPSPNKIKLSAFCLELTGIKQEKVDAAQPLEAVLGDFDIWLKGQIKLRNLVIPNENGLECDFNCAFIAWTDHDFKSYLHAECKRKKIIKPQYFSYWIDLKKIVCKKVPNQQVKFDDALVKMGIPFERKQHSGINDARHTAYLALKLKEEDIKSLEINSSLPYYP